MFDTEIENLSGWLCENAELKALPHTFDDRSQDSAFVIRPYGLIQTLPGTGWTTLKKNYKIYIQYKGTELRTIIALLTEYIRTCNGGKIMGINDNSRIVFPELFADKEFNSKVFKFAYIILEMTDIVKAIKCKPSC